MDIKLLGQDNSNCITNIALLSPNMTIPVSKGGKQGDIGK